MKQHLRLPRIVGVLLLTLEVGCSSTTVPGQSSSPTDLSSRFTANQVPGSRRTAEGGSFTPHFTVVRNGISRNAMVLEAPVTIRMPLAGVGPGATLECYSTPVFNIGDGMQFDVRLVEGDERRVIYSRYYDPGRKLEDRAWIPLKIQLGLAGPAAGTQLEISLGAGPQGDLVADWLALSMIHIGSDSGRR